MPPHGLTEYAKTPVHLRIFFLTFVNELPLQVTMRGTGRKKQILWTKTNVQTHHFPFICFSFMALRETIQSTRPITFPDTHRLPDIWARGSQKSRCHAIK